MDWGGGASILDSKGSKKQNSGWRKRMRLIFSLQFKDGKNMCSAFVLEERGF